MPCSIVAVYWIIPAVRKHVIPEEALTGAGVAVGVEEALDDGVIVSALEIIEAGLGVVVVSAVAQGIPASDSAVRRIENFTASS